MSSGRTRNPRYASEVSTNVSEDFVWPPPEESLKPFVFNGDQEKPRPRTRVSRPVVPPSKAATPKRWGHLAAIASLVLAMVASAGMVVRSHSAGLPRVQPLASGSNRDMELVAASNENVHSDSTRDAALGTGLLNVVTEPPGARVKVDGADRGVTPVLLADLEAGQHTVVLESALGSLPQRVTVEPLRTVSLVVRFTDAADVLDDPTADPTSRLASPRARDLRRRVLSTLVRERYAAARTAFDSGQPGAAADQLTQMFALLESPDLSASSDSSFAELRALAGGGLLELVAAGRVKTGLDDAAGPGLYSDGDTGISRPVALSQSLPPWPSTSRQSPWGSHGFVGVVIDEEGHVESAKMHESIQPFYDLLITAAAKNWRYQPALKDGRPVKYKDLVEVSIR